MKSSNQETDLRNTPAKPNDQDSVEKNLGRCQDPPPAIGRRAEGHQLPCLAVKVQSQQTQPMG